ncbi:hypothetical protein [Defluviimonas sp. SAOS-178_SWC]|uniref:hypothetical protein n=1 Tax=Defluviimonas sp. SAOS-178_SWC TaxID=3121287 RepID=UPI003221CE06
MQKPVAGTVQEQPRGNGKTLRSFDIGGEVHGIGLADDDRKLFVSGRTEPKAWMIDAATRGEPGIISVKGKGYQMVVPP